jgi:hypothetical protein
MGPPRSKARGTGRCVLCGQMFTASAIGRHIESCYSRRRRERDSVGSSSRHNGATRRTEAPESAESMHLSIRGREDLSKYWMHVEASSGLTLADLDSFLRKVWVECCGHLSAFQIRGEEYSTHPDEEFFEKSANVKLGSVLSKGVKFSYEYDFGTTTELDLKVVSLHRPSRLWGVERKTIQIVARNEMPEILCGTCGKRLATKVCAVCIHDAENQGKAWFCDECSTTSRNKCDPEFLLPVVNSPRVGMCGYRGKPLFA